MMDNTTNKGFSSLFLIAVVFYIWHTTIPALGYKTPAVLFAGCILFLYAYIFVKNRIISNSVGLILPILGLYFLELVYSGTSNFAIKIYQILQMGLYPLLILYIAKYGNERLVRFLFWAVIGSYVFTAITTYAGCIMYPGAARTLALPEEEMGANIFAMYKMANIGNLTFTYSLVLLIPQLIFLIKSRIVKRLQSITMLVVLVITILETEYTTALLLMTICFSLFFIPVHITKKHIWGLITVAGIIFIFSKLFIGDLLIGVSSSVGSETMAARLNDLGMILKNGMKSADEGDVGSRMELYNMSIQSFLKSPLLGGIKSIGGHSLFFDSLGRFGLLGLAAFVISYKKIWSEFYKPFSVTPYYGYLLFSFILVVVMAFFNPKDNLSVVTFTIPLFTLFYNQQYESSLDRQ